MGIFQTLGNLTDKAGTALKLKEFGLSEKLAKNRPTVNTGVTKESRAFGFTPYTPANMSNKSSGLSLLANKQQATQPQANKPMVGPMNNPNRQKSNITADVSANLGGGSIGGGGGSTQSAQDAEQARQNAEQEKTNETFRQQLGNQYSDLRGKFGSAITDIGDLLNTLPGQLKQLNTQYKTAIGEKQGAELGNVATQREGVQQDQRRGIMAVKQDVAKSMRDVSNRLANVGAGSSSAKQFFAQAIQNAGNESTKKVVEQAANNYALLDDQEKKIKSNYQTLIDELDREEQSNLANINKDVPAIKASVDEALRQSGEYETLDKNGLTNAYLARLVPLYEQAKQSTDSYRKQLESWRTENQNKIGQLRNQIVQDFTPKQITYDKLNAVKPDTTIEGEEDITQPNALLERARRLRERGLN